jgi:uncharacterized protein YjbI with pentapeptide repeats
MNEKSIEERELAILRKSIKWWNWYRKLNGYKRINLHYADLKNADLSYANLRNANLRNADLSYANLRNADLHYADLKNANLSYANLSYANLRNADLSYANLRNADLRNADLSYADLDYSCLSFSCKSLFAKFDQKHIYQILFHAAKPCTKNDIVQDKDLKELLNSELFKKVANRFHRSKECGELT